MGEEFKGMKAAVKTEPFTERSSADCKKHRFILRFSDHD